MIIDSEPGLPESGSDVKTKVYDLNINLITSSLDITSESPHLLEDIPLLVSDHEMSDDETGSNWSFKTRKLATISNSISQVCTDNTIAANENSSSQAPNKVIEEVNNFINNLQPANQQVQQPVQETNKGESKVIVEEANQLNLNDIKAQTSNRQQLMMLIVKYIATKINNSFPPETTNKELLLDKYLVILISRLKLSLSMFLKSMIYLFRYMDIIYLLRYLNQSNNFANYNSMDFELKKLIIGCCKLVILQERKIIHLKNSKLNHQNKLVDTFNYDWNKITGLSNQEINKIVKTIITRMNGKLTIRNIELVKLKTEIFRFAKMIQ